MIPPAPPSRRDHPAPPRRWWIRCLVCDWRDLAENQGIVRWGAVSLSKRIRWYCPQCGRRVWCSLHQVTDPLVIPPLGTRSDNTSPHVGSKIAALVVLLVLSIATFVASLFFGLEVYFRGHPVTRKAMAMLNSHPVAEAVGPPFVLGWTVAGSIRNDKADLTIPVSGSNMEGSLQVQAQYVAGEWQLRECHWEPNRGPTTSLMAAPPARDSTAVDSAPPANVP